MDQEPEAVLWSIPVADLDQLKEQADKTLGIEGLDAAFRAHDVSRVTAWTQQSPSYLSVLWEGRDAVHSLQEMAVTKDPAIALLRGLLRVVAGPDETGMIWDAVHHRIFNWSTGEAGRDSEARVFHGQSGVDEYLRFIGDVRTDPALFAVFDRIRRKQGFTRADLWHQTWRGREIVISLWEAEDLSEAMEAVQAKRTNLDERIMKIRHAALGDARPQDNPPTLLFDWRA